LDFPEGQIGSLLGISNTPAAHPVHRAERAISSHQASRQAASHALAAVISEVEALGDQDVMARR
jgi:hypothetical protein